MRSCVICALVLAAGPGVVLAQGVDLCSPSSSVIEAFGQLPEQSLVETAWAYRQRNLDAIGALRGMSSRNGKQGCRR